MRRWSTITNTFLSCSADPREVSGVHELTVSCRDRGRRENADFARVQVTVTDDNDHDPAFLETMIVAKVRHLCSPDVFGHLCALQVRWDI